MGGSIGHDAIDAKPDELLHLRPFIDRPDLDRQISSSCGLHQTLVDGCKGPQLRHHHETAERGGCVEVVESQFVQNPEQETFVETGRCEDLRTRRAKGFESITRERGDGNSFRQSVLFDS
ncbi:uncharacterized protein METZ01_LOCUS396955, partial [marine metagenome]